MTPEERFERILAELDAVSDPAMIRNLLNPRGKATKWLIEQDLRFLCPYDPNLIQRWVLAVIYFSTNGNSWFNCSAVGTDPCGSQYPFLNETRFLSPNIECNWAGISCNANETVTEIKFGKNIIACNGIGGIVVSHCSVTQTNVSFE